MANAAIVQLGAWNATQDLFVAHQSSPTSAVIDLNDGVNFSLNDSDGGMGDALDWNIQAPTLFKATNPRSSHGARVTGRVHDQSREVTVRLIWGQGSSYTAWQTAIHNLIAVCEGITTDKPGALKVQPSGGGTPYYLDILAAFIAPPYKELKWIQLFEDEVEIKFTCKPFFRGSRLWFSNLVINPGFEAPAGPGVVSFNDTLANQFAYDPQSFSAAVLVDAPARYYTLDEAVGTVAIDSGSQKVNGTYVGGYTQAQTGPLGGADYAVTFNGSTGTITVPTTGFTNGNISLTFECLVNFASNPSGNIRLIHYGNAGVSGQYFAIGITNTGAAFATTGAAQATSAAISTGAWHHVVGKYDGANVSIVVDNTTTSTAYTLLNIPNSATTSNLASVAGSSAFYGGTLDEAALYFFALSGTRITAHYNAFTGLGLAQDTYRFPDALDALNGAAGTASTTLFVQRYFRADEASGLVAYDASGLGQNGTISATGVTLGATSLLTGDTDTAWTFAGASSGQVTFPTTGLPTGNTAVTLGAMIKFASNPAATVGIVFVGNTGANGMYIGLSSLGKPIIDVNGTAFTAPSALSTGTPHFILGSWDGTTARLYADGSLVTSGTPGTANLTYGGCAVGSLNGGNYFTGQIDEAFVLSGATTGAQVTALWNAANVSPTTTANTLLIPAGQRVQFGSTKWNTINQWRSRWRYVNSLTGSWYLLYTSSTTYLTINVTGTQLAISQDISGSVTSLGTASMQLVNGIQYWMTITAFPGGTIICTINNDSGGAIGSTSIATVTSSPVTTLTPGPLMIAASGAALGIGGNFSSVHTVSLFGPGNWTPTDFLSDATYCAATYAWEQTAANTYPNGPVTSFGAARVEVPLAGKYNASWYTGGSSNMPTLCPVKTGGDVLGVSIALNATGITTGTQALYLNEYTSAGSFVVQHAVSGATHTGSTSGWTTLSGTYTTGGTTAFVQLIATASNSTVGADAGGIVWWDNAQIWDQTNTQATMPYCELRFSQAPAQLMISGIVGDAPAPAMVAMGTYYVNMASGEQMTFALGRRQLVGAGTQLVTAFATSTKASRTLGTPVLDTTSYGGYYWTQSGSSAYGQPSLVPSAQSLSNLQGVYHGIARLYTTESSILTAQASVNSQQSIGTIQAATWYGSYASVFSTASTWTFADMGQLNIPFEGRNGFPGMRSLTAVTAQPWIQLTDSTGNTTFQANWGALLPMDGGILTGTLTNPSNAGANATTWAYVYVDGTNAPYGQITRSLEASSVPNPGNGMGGIGTLTTGFINLTSTSDPYLMIDPGTTVSGTSINQFVGVLSDQSGTVLAWTSDFAYTPLYLIPK